MSGPGGMVPCPALLALVNSSWPHGAAGRCANHLLWPHAATALPVPSSSTLSCASVSPSLPAGRARGGHLAVSPPLSLPLTRQPSPGSAAAGRIQSLGRIGAGWAPALPGTKPGWRRAAGCVGAAGPPWGVRGNFVLRSCGHGMYPAAERLCRAPAAPAQQDPNPPEVEGCESITHHALWQATTPTVAGSNPCKVAGSGPILWQHPPRGGSNARAEQPLPPCTGPGST